MLPLVLLILFFAGAAAFGLWAYNGREEYRTKAEQKISAAVKVAKTEEGIAKDKQNAEANQLPLKTYIGPEQYGSIRVSYPKTWSGYVIDSGNTSQPLDGYFQPGVVPSLADVNSTFALRIQVVSQPYATIITQLNAGVLAKTVTAKPYAFPKVPSVVGVRFDGAIVPSKKVNGSMIVVPIRDKTLQIWTESVNNANDFNTDILPNVSFSP